LLLLLMLLLLLPQAEISCNCCALRAKVFGGKGHLGVTGVTGRYGGA